MVIGNPRASSTPSVSVRVLRMNWFPRPIRFPGLLLFTHPPGERIGKGNQIKALF